jgi:hypothetical protein
MGINPLSSCRSALVLVPVALGASCSKSLSIGTCARLSSMLDQNIKTKDYMKNFDSRTYSINDFIEWYDKDQLELAPKFQRKNVWTDRARSYLMDTIVRGKPIPKIFLRQKLNLQTKTSVREVVDGQQRLRTIISYVKDGFKISKSHNQQYGELYFSQLNLIDDEIQSSILNYEMSVDLLVNLPDSEILDIFGRLNSYAITLNEQEKINANHFSQFKQLVDKIAHKYHDTWVKSKILTDQSILRMGDAALVSDILVAVHAGIKAKRKIKSYYDAFEKFDIDEPAKYEERFDETMEVIRSTFPKNQIAETEFSRVHLFYTLFTVIYHIKFGVVPLDESRIGKMYMINNPERIAAKLGEVDKIYEIGDPKKLNDDAAEFLNDCRRATTDEPVRIRRSKFILSLLEN